MKNSKDRYKENNFRSRSYNNDKEKLDKYDGENIGILEFIRNSACRLYAKFMGGAPTEESLKD